MAIQDGAHTLSPRAAPPAADPARRAQSALRRLIPLADRVLVKKMLPKTQTTGGIFLPETAASKNNEAEARSALDAHATPAAGARWSAREPSGALGAAAGASATGAGVAVAPRGVAGPRMPRPSSAPRTWLCARR